MRFLDCFCFLLESHLILIVDWLSPLLQHHSVHARVHSQQRHQRRHARRDDRRHSEAPRGSVWACAFFRILEWTTTHNSTHHITSQHRFEAEEQEKVRRREEAINSTKYYMLQVRTIACILLVPSSHARTSFHTPGCHRECVVRARRTRDCRKHHVQDGQDSQDCHCR